MRILIHVKKFYDWEPLPDGVEPTEQDIKATRVKPAADGRWLMRVPQDRASYTEIQLPESELIALIMQDAVKEGIFLNRAEAAGNWIGRHIASHHFHRTWVTKIEVVDEGPVRAIFDAEFTRLRDANQLQDEDLDLLVDKYEMPFNDAALVSHFNTRLGVKAQQEVT
jgi:hypothetical protein